MKYLIFGWVLIGFTAGFAELYYYQSREGVEVKRDMYLQQLTNEDSIPAKIRMETLARQSLFANFWVIYLGVSLLTILLSQKTRKALGFVCILGFMAINAGCYRPFEPVDLQTISPNEEAFLIPLQGDTKKQVSTSSEEFLKQNLVLTKQVRIPQQWVPIGYETFGPNGSWKPSAILIKVDRSPLTREWTADANSGTSNKNEAVWVMTADQVEFSTGWTCTARILTRDDAVKFLFNYPNGTLDKVLDQEVRARLQSEFGIEVTDLPMDNLRKNATPHIQRVVKDVKAFFELRGINITNLGITGGFIYKNPTISEKLVEVFNAEQEQNIRLAKFQAQEVENKRVNSEAEGKARALLTEKQAEAKGIQAVADAKAYEIIKAKEDLASYLALKRLEVETLKVKSWDGKFPTYFMGGNNPGMLLEVPLPTK